MSEEVRIQEVRKHRCPEGQSCAQEHLDIPRDDDEIIGVTIYSDRTDTKVQLSAEGFTAFLVDVIAGRYDEYLPKTMRRVLQPLTDNEVEINLNTLEPIFGHPPMPSPTDGDLESPQFNAIWSVIKTWDVNVPEYYELYCGANGSHVMLILNALRTAEAATEVEADRQAAIARGELD